MPPLTMDNAGETRSDARVASEGPALREHRDQEGSPTGGNGSVRGGTKPF